MAEGGARAGQSLLSPEAFSFDVTQHGGQSGESFRVYGAAPEQSMLIVFKLMLSALYMLLTMLMLMYPLPIGVGAEA